MMRQRGDMHCFHEPFGEAWYYGEQPLWPRWTEQEPKKTGLTLQSVLETIKRAALSRPVFSKDMAHYVAHLWNPEYLSQFQHSFLIRHPHKAISSIYRDGPEFGLDEIGIDKQRELFDLVKEYTGETPPVIDSDDLLENPVGMVEAYCNILAIPFIEEALTWEPGARGEVSWYDSGSWHDTLKNSDGLKPQNKKYVDIEQASDLVKDVCNIVMPHYQHMYQHRLTVPTQ